MRIISILIILLMITICSCGPGYYLRRAKLNTMKAIANGAKVDPAKTILHDTLYINKINDRVVKEKQIDTVTLKELCPEVKTPTQKNALQKTVCPEVSKDTTYRIYVKIQGNKYPIDIHVKASSIDGVASLQVDSKEIDIPFVKEEDIVNLQPGTTIKWWQVALIGIGCLIVGFVLGKVFNFGVRL